MSVGPSRLDTKYSHLPSADHAGLWLSDMVSVTVVSTPSRTRQSTIRLGARLPNDVPTWAYHAFPAAQAMKNALGDQVQRLGSNIRAIK